MTFEIKKKAEESITIYGEKYVVIKPKVLEVKQMQKELQAANKDSEKEFDITMKYIENRGIPKNVIEDLDVDEFQGLVEYLVGKKK